MKIVFYFNAVKVVIFRLTTKLEAKMTHVQRILFGFKADSRDAFEALVKDEDTLVREIQAELSFYFILLKHGSRKFRILWNSSIEKSMTSSVDYRISIGLCFFLAQHTACTLCKSVHVGYPEIHEILLAVIGIF